MKFQTLIWQDKEGSTYLIYKERTTHTGTHVDIHWTPDIEFATQIKWIPNSEIRKTVVPVFVEVETKVTLIEE